MSNRSLSRIAGTASTLLVLILVLTDAHRTALDGLGDPILEGELGRLTRLGAHAPAGSALEYKTQRKLERLAAIRAGMPGQERPDEFARIHAEMRTPADQTGPSYPAGYRRAELQKARASRKFAGVPLPWMSRGPGNVAGRTRGLIVDPIDPSGNTWYIASVGGGIWKTPDGGASWSDLTPDIPNLPVQSLAMAASDNDIIYAGTGESFYNVDTINGNGMLKSVDRGATWTQLASTLDDPRFNNVSRIIVDPTNPDIVVASCTTGRYKEGINPSSSIFKSIDGGASWTEVYTETELGVSGRVKKIQQVVATPGDFDVQFAAVDEKGILKSIDAGDTWTLSSAGITDLSGRFEIAISPLNTSRIFAAAEGSPNSNLWVSNDAGAIWARTFENGGDEPSWLGFQGWYDNTIVCDPNDVDRVYVGGIQLWQITLTSATQRTSIKLSASGVHVDHHNLVVIDDGGGNFRLLNANDGGVAVSSNAASGWSQPIGGLVTTQFYGIDKKPGASAYVGGMQDNSTWRSPVDPTPLDPWTFQIGGDGYETSWHFNDPMKIIGGYQFNGIMRSLDGGLTWNGATSGLSDTGGGNAPFITKIAKSNGAPDLLFAVGAQGVWRSTNFGGSWNLTPLFAPDWAPIGSFTDVKISRANADVVWAGARMDDTGKINLSTNQGLSFSPTTNFTDVTMGGISGLATHPADDQVAYVLFSFAQKPKILRTTDQGATWHDISGFGTGTVSTNGFPDVAVYDLLVLPHDTNILWAGTEIGLFESTDGGSTWQLADNGLPAAPIWAMTAVEDEVVLATHGRGVWSVEIPEMATGSLWNPLVNNAYQGPEGFLTVELNLRSAYESSDVWIDGSIYTTLAANEPLAIETIQVPVVSAATIDVYVVGHIGADDYTSVTHSVDVVPLAAAAAHYVADFNGGSSDWTGVGFTISQLAGFSDAAIHSIHPYQDLVNWSTMLTVPIQVALSNAYVAFDEIAIIESGEPGSVFGDFEFWDYVVVEGSTDGINWIPLADGWDARDDAAWLSAYNSSSSGTESMFRRRELDLHDAFSPGDVVLLRWSLVSDGAVTGWGWAIDDVEIQVGSPTASDDLPGRPSRFALEQNHPNPFNPSTTIRYRLAVDSAVSLRVYDQRGRLVRTLVNGPQEAGEKSVSWDGRSDGGASVASGIYFYRLSAGDFVDQRKMTLLK